MIFVNPGYVPRAGATALHCPTHRRCACRAVCISAYMCARTRSVQIESRERRVTSRERRVTSRHATRGTLVTLTPAVTLREVPAAVQPYSALHALSSLASHSPNGPHCETRQARQGQDHAAGLGTSDTGTCLTGGVEAELHSAHGQVHVLAVTAGCNCFNTRTAALGPGGSRGRVRPGQAVTHLTQLTSSCKACVCKHSITREMLQCMCTWHASRGFLPGE